MKANWERLTASYFKPDVVSLRKLSDIGFIHRQLNDGDLYFVANTSNQPKVVEAKFRHRRRYAEWWDPFTGRVSAGQKYSQDRTLAATL